ncbi:hypothetical protein EH244_29900 [Variovorax beijingensis]|uniref:Uncharacterized protein n=1 Tax=Variovorax beijingensis TaxID=2496117 RepID=A0A3P3E429_9BURK|nr:hypothetical protein [Variovorax beijingensis]RRH80806.1 hypothetical protein EH244_29900 [Variovorax beijingensis]
MIKYESPLRRLPPGIDRTQVLILDGIRHAAEIATLAYARLNACLTEIALGQPEQTENEQHAARVTGAYLDAWAIVDSIDRMRALVRLLPADEESSIKRAEQEGQLQGIRNLRNVADHLAQRLDYVAAHDSTALGMLAWFTLISADKGRSCLLLPGSFAGRVAAAVPNPAGKEFHPPTDFIELSAGEHSASLSGAMRIAQSQVESVERGIGRLVEQHGLHGKHMGADATLIIDVEFHPDPMASSSDGSVPGG